MSYRRTLSIVFLLAVLVPSALSLLTGCDSKPAAPRFNNPFDPEGTDSGDPFNLTATLGDTSITLIWDQVQGYNLSRYDVMHSLQYDVGFFPVGSVEATDQSSLLFKYLNPQPTTRHFFKIQAYDNRGSFTLMSHIVPTTVATLARVVVNDGSTLVSSRHITLGISVSSGDSLRISQSGHPDSEIVLAADESGTPVTLPWDLGAADSNDTTMVVNVVVQNGSLLGMTNAVEMDLDFHPQLALVGGGTAVALLNPFLLMETTGLDSMRFAANPQDLSEMPWLAGAEYYAGHQLIDSANPQTIHAEFLGDFGFSTFDEITVTPDLLTDVGFYLALPQDHISDQTTLKANCDARATFMRFSESLDFSDTPWQVYRDSVDIVISPEPGQKIIYAQYRNDFAESPILTDYVIYLLQPVEVAITAPSDGNVVRGGSVLRVQGTATAPSGTAAVDSVKFDGGSGFLPVEGTNNWHHSWEIPRFSTDTDFVIRARAWSDDDSTTTHINVTVTQLAVTITSPLEGAEVVGDTDVLVAGVAAPVLGGAPIDSVTITIDGQTQLADGTDSWSFDWHPAAVDEVTEETITATVYALTDQHSTTVNVSIVPE
jgi:Bacterial Ig domain